MEGSGNSEGVGGRGLITKAKIIKESAKLNWNFWRVFLFREGRKGSNPGFNVPKNPTLKNILVQVLLGVLIRNHHGASHFNVDNIYQLRSRTSQEEYQKQILVTYIHVQCIAHERHV